MNISTFILLGIACYWLYKYFQKRLNYFNDLGIPYVPGLPFFGNVAATAFRRKHFIDTIRYLYNYYPDAKYVGAFNFCKPVIILRDPEIIKDVTIKNFDNFVDHLTLIDEKLDPIFGGNLFSMTGDRWKEARNLLTPAFTSSKMKAMFESMRNCAENVINYVEKEAQNPKNVIATKVLFAKYTNDVIASCAFGINIDSLKDPNNPFYVLGKEATSYEGTFAIKMSLSKSFPQLMKFFKIKIVADHVAKFFMDIVRETVTTRDEKGISRPDMIQLMMDARNKTSNLLKLDITEMTAQAFIFFFGGFDTASTQMCIIAQELAINPDVQERLQAEIDSIMEEYNGKPTYDAIHEMAYLDAVFNESMRFHTQGYVLDRLCTKAFELPPALPGYKSFVVPPGMNIWIPAAGIHYDEKYYENPGKFHPDRYLNKKVTINQVENLGFGIGPRGCIGYRFTILETKILFFYLLAKFTIKPNSKTCNPIVYKKNNLSFVPEGGYWVTFEPRANIH